MAPTFWRFAAAGVAVALVVLVIRQVTRAVPPFQPPPDQNAGAWGSLDAEGARRMQAVLDRQVNELRVPGLQAYVRLTDGRTWSGTSGTIDLGRRTPMSREHVLRVGSTTKTFLAVVILQLADENRLSLDDPLSKWFPDIPNADRIAIRNLLNHSSGIPEFLQDSEVITKSILPWRRWQPEEVIAIALKREPEFAPRQGWGYSNTNYVVLGLIAERVTGHPAAELFRERILTPLGLRNTYFIPYEAAPMTLVTGFDRDLSHFPGMLDITPENVSWASAAFTSGAMASTADDLGLFYQALFSGELLPTAAVREMTTFVDAPNPGFEVQNGYGLGLMRLEVNGQEYMGHVGEFMGSTAIAMYAPEGGELLVITTNLSFPDLVGTLADLHGAASQPQ